MLIRAYRAALPLLLALLAALPAALPAGAVEVQDVLSPRPRGWVTDEGGVLTPAERETIDRIGYAVRRETGGEMAVVVLPSLEGREPRPFAMELFNYWGIGRPEANDGVLVLVAMEDRAVEIVLGDGVDGAPQKAASDQAMEVDILPHFREGRPGAGLVAGARALAAGIYRIDSAAMAAEPVSPPPPSRAEPAPPSVEPAPPPVRPAVEAPPGDVGDPADSGAGADSAAAPRQPAVTVPAPAEQGEAREGRGCLFWAAVVVLGPFGLLVLLALAFPRRCPDCKAKMRLLSEQEEDAHLTAAEQSEERVKSVNHNVWACPQCGRAEKTSTKLFSKHTPCPECGRRTRSRVTEVLIRPTHEAPGQGRLEEHCEHCDFHHKEIYALPVLPPKPMREKKRPAPRREPRPEPRRRVAPPEPPPERRQETYREIPPEPYREPRYEAPPAPPRQPRREPPRAADRSSDGSSSAWSFAPSPSRSTDSSKGSSGFSGGRSSSSSSSSRSSSSRPSPSRPSGFKGGKSSGGGSSGKW